MFFRQVGIDPDERRTPVEQIVLDRLQHGGFKSRNLLDVTGLDVPERDLAELLRVDVEDWRAEIPSIEEHYAQFGDRVPEALRDQLHALEKRLSN